ncbi:voltage-gated ion channel superfamily [Reticulomyxa filosa]|uniref:Voltage-gated ion channel superfamily n=1 Tax=Reticulomyxa filosa TaxID=46433 RepID=X6MGC3_RETFI|nr:voltage-gated ion channel superfamily [Reticulomyxa filosa]|eukprot:ETO13073.1 voltage-gated ion channel superfamily [Reticulomyxa filosa]
MHMKKQMHNISKRGALKESDHSEWSGALCWYFIFCVALGNFLMVNMIVAILLNSMNEAVNSDWDSYRYLLPKAQFIQQEHPYWTVQEYQWYLLQELKLRRERHAYQTHIAVWNKRRNKSQLMGKSLGIFDQHSKIRQGAFKLVHHKTTTLMNKELVPSLFVCDMQVFTLIVNILIFLSCLLLALDSHTLHKDTKLYATIESFNIVFATLFACEMIVKFIAFGVTKYPLHPKRTYHYITHENELHKWKVLCRQQFEKTFKVHPQFKHVNQYRGGGIYDCVQCVNNNPNSSDDVYYIAHYMFTEQKFNIRFLFVKDNERHYRYKASYIMNETTHRKWTPFQFNGVNHGCHWDDELHQVCTSVMLNNANSNAYFTSNWNRLDAVVVFVSLLALIFPSISFLRSLRAIRPLRIAARNPRIKRVLNTLMAAIIPATSSILFAGLFMLILAIVGVQFLSGRMSYCSTFEDGMDYHLVENEIRYELSREECHPTEEQPHLKWVTNTFNFDNLLNAFVTVFILSAWDGWNLIMWNAVDATDMDKAPKKDNHPEYGAFFVLVLIVGGFFSLRLIVSVILEEFKTQKRFQEGTLFQSQTQADWVRTQHLLLKFRLQNRGKPPLNKFRAQCFYLANHRYESAHRFDWFILGCVILNTIQMGMKHYDQSKAFDTLEVASDLIFVSIFTMEAIIRIIGLGWKYYWRSNWNKLDFLILLVSYPGLLFACFPYLGAGFQGVQAQMIRTFRIARMLRLLTTVKTLNFLARMFLFALPSLSNIAVTVFIIFYIFSVVGVNLFGHVDSGLKRYSFRDFPHALYTLFLCSTGESWWVMVGKCMSQSNKYIAILYWLLFFLVGGLVSMNLFIGVILDTFSENVKSEVEHEKQLMSVTKLVNAWNEEDPRGTGLIPANKFWRLLLRTPFPTGFTQPLSNDEAELNDEAYRRFLQIINSGVYKEPSLLEVREHISTIKFVCQKGIKIGYGKHAEYRLLSEEQEDMYAVGCKILNFFINLCNEDDHGHEENKSEDNLQMKLKEDEDFGICPGELAVSTSSLPPTESEKKSDEDSIWLVKFEDAIIALCTSITGPEISARVNDRKYEMMFLDWWDKYEAENFVKNVAGHEGALGAESMLSFVDQWLKEKKSQPSKKEDKQEPHSPESIDHSQQKKH